MPWGMCSTWFIWTDLSPSPQLLPQMLSQATQGHGIPQVPNLFFISSASSLMRPYDYPQSKTAPLYSLVIVMGIDSV
jgi:hypothetical protein